MKLGTVFLLVGCIWLHPCQSRSANGYRALIGCGDGFLAAGSGGRMDWISTSGVVTKSIKPTEFNLNALLSYQQTLFAAGDSGILLLSNDNQSFRKVDVGTGASIFCLTRFNNRMIAGSEQGMLLVGDENGVFKHLSLALEGNIVSLSSSETACFGVTDKGEILHSMDGIHWTLLDFNTYYAGYYRPCRFTSVLVTKNQIAVAGVHDDGSPALMLSSEGTIWAERSLNYSGEQGEWCNLKERPFSMYDDALQDQILLVCSNGKVMKIPSCSHCNQLLTISAVNNTCLCENKEYWLVVGDDFSLHALEAGWK